MRINKNLPAVIGATAVLVFALGVAGCGDDHDSGGPGANATDAAFINDMTAHHQGAIEMAELATDRAEHREIRDLAGRVIAAQNDEIDLMAEMRDAMRSMHSDDTHDGDMGMSEHAMGMDMDMAALRRARPFDRAFMDAMISHHEGAIAMAKELLAKGEHPQLREMAQAIIDAQGAEIDQMRRWHERWYGADPGAMDMGE